jgi:predicted regulator of Ras-like GTPase activity (Roadblock/LC7/MglB family)
VIKETIDDLGRVEGVRLALVVSLDGLLVASTGVGGEDDEVVAAMAAAILGTVGRAAARAGLGRVSDILIGAANSSLQLLDVNDVIIVVVAHREANVGLIRLAMRRTAKKLKEFLVKEQ